MTMIKIIQNPEKEIVVEYPLWIQSKNSKNISNFTFQIKSFFSNQI